MYHLDFPLVLLLLGVHFAINNSFSMRSAPNKSKYIRKCKFRIFPLDYSILQRAYIGWSKQSTLVTCQGFKVFVYSIQSFIRWCCVSSVFATPVNNRKWNYSRVQGLAHDFPVKYRFHVFLAKVSPWNFVWLPDFNDLSISVHTMYFQNVNWG